MGVSYPPPLLGRLTQRMSLVSCHIQKFYTNAAGYTEYFILILFQGREWAIRKRYSDFLRFDEFLRNSGQCLHYQLPEKNWWNKFDPTLLSKRLKELQNYLDVLLRETVSAENSLVREFLEVDENMLALAKKQSFKEISYSDKMVLIVKQTRKAMIAIPSNRDSLGDFYTFPRTTRTTSSHHHHTGSSPSDTPRKMSKDSPNFGHHGHAQRGGHGGSFDGRANARTGIGSFSASVTNLRTGIGSFSGNVNSVDAALAVADASRRDAFSSHVSRLWKLAGRQTEEKLLELECAESDLPIPHGAMFWSAAFSDSPGGEDPVEPGPDPVAGSRLMEDVAAAGDCGRGKHAWVIDTLSEPVRAGHWAGLLAIEARAMCEQLPRTRLALVAGDPSSCVRHLIVPPLATAGEKEKQGATSPRHRGERTPSASPPMLLVGRDKIRRNNSEGTVSQKTPIASSL